MTTSEKLELIKDKCREIIALGEKRTQGKWMHSTNQGQIGDVCTMDEDSIAMTQERVEFARMADLRGGWRTYSNEQRQRNAAFIAACAGPSEAMAKSTIGVIECCTRDISERDGEIFTDGAASDVLSSILAAWPDDILTPAS